MNELKRADIVLVESGKTTTRSKASQLIDEGVVF
jgi:predicted rRNA methylase YqxC with S4 and FtsJ domains